MQVAVVEASELGDRWDAPFHVARKQCDDLHRSMEAEAGRLRETWSAEAAIGLLEGLDAELLAPVRDLARGDGRNAGGRHALDRTIREYPHLALALVCRNAPAAMETVGARIRLEQAKLDALATLTGATLIAGHIYPLKDPTRFDDEEGTGFDHVMFDEVTTEKRLQWGWVCKDDYDVHPGFPDPIQVAPWDVDLSRGRLVEAPEPWPSVR